MERFEIGEVGLCTLTARWRVTSAGDTVQSDSQLGAFTAAAALRTDADVAAAMTSDIDQLAGRIAATLQSSALGQSSARR